MNKLLILTLEKLGLNVNKVGTWIWFQFPAWGNWWLGLSFHSKAASFADVKGRWFFVPLFTGKTVTVTLPNGEKVKAVNRQGYPQPWVVQKWNQETKDIGLVVLSLTEEGKILVKNNARASGIETESPRASHDNENQPELTKPIKLGAGSFDLARIAAEGGKKPNATFYAQINKVTEGHHIISVDQAWKLDDAGMKIALGLLAYETKSFDPVIWIKWLQNQSE